MDNDKGLLQTTVSMKSLDASFLNYFSNEYPTSRSKFSQKLIIGVEIFGALVLFLEKSIYL